MTGNVGPTCGEDKSTIYKASKASDKSSGSMCGSAVFLINGKHFQNNFLLPLGAIGNYINDLVPQVQVCTADEAQWVNIHEDEIIQKIKFVEPVFWITASLQL